MPRKRGAPSWLTPFGEAWERATKGVFQYGKAAGDLRGTWEKHGAEKTLRAWIAYLNETPVEKASTSRFVATFGVWSGDVPRTAPAAEGDRFNRNSLARAPEPIVRGAESNVVTKDADVQAGLARIRRENEEREREDAALRRAGGGA